MFVNFFKDMSFTFKRQNRLGKEKDVLCIQGKAVLSVVATSVIDGQRIHEQELLDLVTSPCPHSTCHHVH